MVNVKCFGCFCIVSLCYSRAFLVIENQNVLLEISVSSICLLLFAWCVACDALVLVFYLIRSRSRSPRFFCSYSFPNLGFPAFLIEWYGVYVGFSSLGIRTHCLEFLYLNFRFSFFVLTYHLGLHINTPNCCIWKRDSTVIEQAGIAVYIHNSIADITHRRQDPQSDLAECI